MCWGHLGKASTLDLKQKKGEGYDDLGYERQHKEKPAGTIYQ